MGIADRIILTLYTFLMAGFSLAAVLVSMGMVAHSSLQSFIEAIPGNWIFAISGIGMLLVSLHLLITGIGVTGGGSLHLSDGPAGRVSVSKNALEHYIEDLAEEIYGIHHTKVVVKLLEEGINVRVNAAIEPGINIPETTREVKNNIKESIKKVTGAEVGEIELFVKQIKAKEE